MRRMPPSWGRTWHFRFLAGSRGPASIIHAMLLKAGAVSLGLLVASRLLGLLRESALAATFGTSGLADVAVLMLALPDWLVGVLASGALAYVLLPAWAAQSPAQVGASERRVARWLLLAGVTLAVLLATLRVPALVWLAGGLPAAVRGVAAQALAWSALCLPAALLAALWTTRLQHQRDFVGMYSAGIVVNVVLLAAIFAAGTAHAGAASVAWLGGGLAAAMLLRLAWLRWRQAPPSCAGGAHSAPMPPLPVWLWAALSAGLPLAFPFAARSMASHTGEGALATFSYAWKLVELPLLLAIQLVATLAFPAIAKALSAGGADVPAGSRAQPVRSAFALAFLLACASAAGLLAGAPALAQLLFGWGRMEPEALTRVAQWARIGAWSLLPQSLIAVALTVLAAQRRMKAAVIGYALALAALLSFGASGVTDGGTLMLALDVLLGGVAVVSVLAMGAEARQELPWSVLGASAGALLVLASGLAWLPPGGGLAAGLALAAACAGVVLATGWLAGARLRANAAP